MKKIAAVALAVITLGFFMFSNLSSQGGQAPSTNPDTPFKLANLAGAERGKPAIAVNDRVFELERVNTWTTERYRLSAVTMPRTNLELVEQYDRLKPRLYQIANALASDAPDFGISANSAKFMAPILYPWNLLAVAVNYRAHGEEMARNIGVDYDKDPPFVFAKSPKAGLIGPGDTVLIPEGREKIDWEIEMAVIMGKKAKNVKKDQAGNYIFGYGLILDMSDRGGQTRQSPLFNADWFVGKSRDTFAPMGAYVVPAEFLPNHNELNLKLAVNGREMQNSNTSFMMRNVESLVQFITSIHSLEPGDIIATGTPEGVGNARKPPIYLKSGDVITAEIEGIGSIRTPVK
jgi:2-keto-4-pentenoate hydratase/2-oxohepta-3-ene-1,7-dioic acid hydratase in catechol pathway